MNFTINHVGYDYKQDSDFIISRPLGSSDFLFLFFPCEIDIELDNKWVSIPPYSCLIYTPSYPQHYCHAEGGFTNDWFHFKGTDIEAHLSALSLPLNPPFSIPHYDFIRVLIKSLENLLF